LVEDIGKWGSEDIGAYIGIRNRKVEGLHNEEIQDLYGTKYYWHEQIIQKQMGRPCGTYVKDGKRIQGFSGAT
jgi:hypothetical protein